MEFSQKIVLASASPRRTELLAMAGIPHTVMTAFADEGSVKFDNNSIEKYVCDIARLKNDALFEQKKLFPRTRLYFSRRRRTETEFTEAGKYSVSRNPKRMLLICFVLCRESVTLS